MEIQDQFCHFWRKEIAEINRAIEAGETAAAVGIYGMGQSVLAEIVQSLKFKVQNYRIINLNLKYMPSPTPKDIYKMIARQLSNGAIEQSNNRTPESDFELHYMLRKYLQDDPEIKLTFLCQDAQNLLSFPDSFWDNFENLRYYFSPRVSLVLFGQPGIYNFAPAGLQRLIKNNYLFLRAFDRRTTEADVETMDSRSMIHFGNNVVGNDRRGIWRWSRGHHGTIKFLCQKLNKFQVPSTKSQTNPKSQILKLNKTAFAKWVDEEPLMRLWIDEVFSGLTEEQINAIRQYLEGKLGNLGRLRRLGVMEDLIQFGFFRRHGKKLDFLFENFAPWIKIAKTNGTNMTDRINIMLMEKLCNPQEARIWAAFRQKKGQIVSYEDIAKLLWRSNAEEKFSLWAINKVISRLRQKMAEAALNPRLLKTRAKRGYELTPQN